jgi:hypothetical protein
MSRSGRIILQERDWQLFIFLGQHETATFAQLKERFWPESWSSDTARDRLHKLRQAGFITCLDYRSTPQSAISRYQITKLALKELPAEESSNLFTEEMLDREVEQAIKGVQTRLALEKLGYRVVGWISERQLAGQQQQGISRARSREESLSANSIADGVALIKNPGNGEVVKIEVEIMGQYGNRMIREKVAAFKGRPVFWAATSSQAGRVKQFLAPGMQLLEI